MTEPQITKMEVLTPERVYEGNEDDRPDMPRNEGAEIVLHFSSDDFERVKAKISELPVQGLNVDLYATGDDDQNAHYRNEYTSASASVLPTREEARVKWKETLDSEATLFRDEDKKFVINASIGKEPNTIVIKKLQEDPVGDFLGHVSRSEEYGSQGTRAMDTSDVQKISFALENELGVNVPRNFEKELEAGIGKVQPKHGYQPLETLDTEHVIANAYTNYRDIPGESYSVNF